MSEVNLISFSVVVATSLQIRILFPSLSPTPVLLFHLRQSFFSIHCEETKETTKKRNTTIPVIIVNFQLYIIIFVDLSSSPMVPIPWHFLLKQIQSNWRQLLSILRGFCPLLFVSTAPTISIFCPDFLSSAEKPMFSRWKKYTLSE